MHYPWRLGSLYDNHEHKDTEIHDIRICELYGRIHHDYFTARVTRHARDTRSSGKQLARFAQSRGQVAEGDQSELRHEARRPRTERAPSPGVPCSRLLLC